MWYDSFICGSSVDSHVWMGHESCHTYEWVRCRFARMKDLHPTRMSHVTRMNESCVLCHTHMNGAWVLSRIWIGHALFHMYERHASHMNESCHIILVIYTLYIYMNNVVHSYIYIYIYYWFICLSWHTHMNGAWVMSHIWMSNDTHELCHTYEWVMTHMSYVTHMNE